MNASFRRRAPLLITAGIFAALFTAASLHFENFFSARNVVGLFSNTAMVGIVAVGMTLVIFSGGIDLSVGAVVGFTTIFISTLVEKQGVHPAVAALAALGLGAVFGAAMGAIIHFFKQPAFLVTLAGMFLARGGAFWINTQSIEITHPLYRRAIDYVLPLGGSVEVPSSALVLLFVLAGGYLLAHHTRFGRNLLALGGNEQSARLMGLPVGATKISVYALCGATAALGGLVNTLYTGSGNSRAGIGMELDAITIVVIGGTLLTGGRGHMLGTLCGTLIVGTISTAIAFDGRLSSAWMRIIMGLLLLGFILLQRLLLRATQRRAA